MAVLFRRLRPSDCLARYHRPHHAPRKESETLRSVVVDDGVRTSAGRQTGQPGKNIPHSPVRSLACLELSDHLVFHVGRRSSGKETEICRRPANGTGVRITFLFGRKHGFKLVGFCGRVCPNRGIGSQCIATKDQQRHNLHASSHETPPHQNETAGSSAPLLTTIGPPARGSFLRAWRCGAAQIACSNSGTSLNRSPTKP